MFEINVSFWILTDTWYFCVVEKIISFCSLSSLKHNGNIWPKDGIKQAQVNRVLPDMRHGNVSLIPLRGSENEMRNSVAAFSQDSLAVSEPPNHWD